MFIHKKIWKFLALAPVVATSAWSTTACGASSQFLTQQYLVKFDGELDKDGYLKNGSNNSGTENEHYYRIDTQSSKINYIETDAHGKPKSRDTHNLAGLVAIYAQIAKFITSTTTVLVNYAHENISTPDLLGINFSHGGKGGTVTSLSGDFLFAASSSFASGNRSDNFAFGLATLRFDIQPWSYSTPKKGEPKSEFKWTDSLCRGGSFTKDDQKKIDDALSKHTFLKLFVVNNISILYKFYRFGHTSPSPYYDPKTSCVSISNSDATDIKKFRDDIATPFNRESCSPKLKYQAVSFDPSVTHNADGFVLEMQPLITALSYANDPGKNTKKLTSDEKTSVNLRAQPLFSNVFPQGMWNEWFEKAQWKNKEDVKKRLAPSSFDCCTKSVDTLTKGIENHAFVNDKDAAKTEKHETEYNDYQTLLNGMSSLTGAITDFAAQAASNHTVPSQKIKLSKDNPFVGKTFQEFFKYFFNKAANDHHDIISVVTNSSHDYPCSSFPYFGSIANKKHNGWTN